MHRRSTIWLQRKVKRTVKRLWLRAWLVWMAIGPVPHEHAPPPTRLAR